MLNQSVDRVFHALGDPTRRSLVERLSVRPATVGELAAPLAMSMPAVLQHLKVLEEAGLVRTHKVGRVRTCELDPTALDAAHRWIDARRAAWDRRLDRLGAFLAASVEDDPDPDDSNPEK